MDNSSSSLSRSQLLVATIVVLLSIYWYWQRTFSAPTTDSGSIGSIGSIGSNNEAAAFSRRKSDVCYNVRAVKSLQALQVKRALYEQSLFHSKDNIIKNDNDNDGNLDEGDSRLKGTANIAKNAYIGMQVNYRRLSSFYTLNFGGTSMNLPEKLSKDTREAYYYHILKGANVYIRYLFYRYAYNFGDYIDYKDNTCKLHECADNDIHSATPIELRSSYFSYFKNKRFPFTFVRNPLNRFVSAYTEVEFKWNVTGIRPPPELFSILARPGSLARFEEFVNSLLAYFKRGEVNDADGRRGEEEYEYTADLPDSIDAFEPKVKRHQDEDFLEDSPIRALFDITSSYSDMFQIAPMIGSVLLAREKEKHGEVHVYKLEDFDKQWRNITSILGINKFDDAILESHPTSKYAHHSSGDPLNTTFSALSFLGFASDEAFSKLYYQRTAATASATADTSSINSNLTACSDNLFCYKNSKIAMPYTTTKQFEDLRKRSRYITRSICRLYLADFQCLGYELPGICSDLIEEWNKDSAAYLAKNSVNAGVFNSETFSFNSLVRMLPDWIGSLAAEGLCIMERNPPQCMVDILHAPGHIVRDYSHTEFDVNEIEHLETEVDPIHDEL